MTGLRRGRFACLMGGLFIAPEVWAAGAGVPHLDGSALSLLWGIPFAGLLLSIAVFPLLAPHFWHHHFGKISAFWAMALLGPLLVLQGFSLTLYHVLHALLLEYIPFIILLFALFTISGGIRLRGPLDGTPMVNTGMLFAGTAIASWTGTTGAAMLLIRPVIRANAWRRYRVHTIVFFIFLVANIGGSLTPLGDPPLFLGYLKGVDFFWPTREMFLPMLTLVVVLLALYYLLDSWYYKREDHSCEPVHPPEEPERLIVEGLGNLGLLLGVVLAVLLSGMWTPGISVRIYHVDVELQNLLRDGFLLLLSWVSWKTTAASIRKANDFNWFPIEEVGKLFIGIFITIIPVIAILQAGSSGSLDFVVDQVTRADGSPNESMYFWATGLLSGVLDNAPTYLVFFNTAGGDAEVLMGKMGLTLLAISMGSVFMGALSYIGNAPNFMVRSIAENSGIRMPSFFGYMAWSLLILVPLFFVIEIVFLR